MHNVNWIADEAASAVKDLAAKYSDVLNKIIEEGEYTGQQIFNMDEIGLFWKRMTYRTYISKKDKTHP